jgi:FixJ family two-component response regulator
MPLNVFYLDDEQALCDVFRDTYSSDNVQIFTFTEPSALIQQAKDTPPDLAFFDYCLPSTTGEKVAQVLDPKIPKVLVTGDTGLVSDYPFVKIIYKPWHDKDVLQILENVREKKDQTALGFKISNILAAEKAILLDVCVGQLAHHMSTPLAVIKMRANQLKNLLVKTPPAENITREAANLLSIVDLTIDEMISAIRGLREAVKIETHQSSMNHDLGDSIRSAVTILKLSIEGIEIDLEGMDFRLKARFQPEHLTQIIINTGTYLASQNPDAKQKKKLLISANSNKHEVVIQMTADDFLPMADSTNQMSDLSNLFKCDAKTNAMALAAAEKLAKINHGTMELFARDTKRVAVIVLKAS